jgi:gluconokinase
MKTRRDAKSLLLSIDIGTSSVRAALYDDNAKLIPRTLTKVEWSFTTSPDGGFEIDADGLFGNVVGVIDGVLEKPLRQKGVVEAVAPCSFWHSVVGIDAKGRPTTPVFGWADTRSRKYSEVLRKRFDETAIHNRTGARFHSSFWPAKLLWLRKESSEVWAKTKKWLSFSDYVALKLSGELLTSVSMASATGIFDQRKCYWDAELLRYLRVTRNQLPSITDAAFALNSKFSKRWPRLESAQWFPAIGDGAADNIGSGCTTKTQAALMVGTSGAMRVAYRADPPKRIPDGLWCYRIDRERVIIGGALSDGGNLYQQLREDLEIAKNAEDEMRRRGADAHGITILPFFHGERSTGYNENAHGSILGLNVSHDAIDILQAAMESVAYRFAEILNQLGKLVRIREMVASGGALRESPVWTQIIADVLGRDLLINNAQESSLRGAVLLALERLGKIENLDRFTSEHGTLRFHPECHEVYKGGRKRHQKYYSMI